MQDKKESPNRVVLISTPWPLYHYPSIQLGTLKAYLQSHFHGLTVEAHHHYLRIAEAIGYKVYQAISRRTWLAEAIYAALLYPENLQGIEEVFEQEAESQPLLREIGFESLCGRVQRASEACIAEVNGQNALLAGFSICLCQLTSTIFFIKRIKKRFPGLPVVVGGSGFSSESAGELLAVLSEVDYIVVGEGEIPLAQLVRHLRESPQGSIIPTIRGIISRDSNDDRTGKPFSQLEDLDALPMPHFDDYFHLLDAFDSTSTFIPTLPLEISRGCWWQQVKGFQNMRGCAFCNLNQQWEGYRSKKPAQVVMEVDRLTSKHKTFSVAFTDNSLPVVDSREIFGRLGNIPKDFRFFAELRAGAQRKDLEVMRNAGLEDLQIGIESLSTRLLKKMNKGTTTIQNLQIMKYCEELGINNVSNLILYFPGSDAEDVKETLRALEFVLPFRPLRAVSFWLGLGSPICLAPGSFGIASTANHPNYNSLLPSEMVNSVQFMIRDYQGDQLLQKSIWQPVKEQLQVWRETYNELHRQPFCGPALGFRNGPDFLIITQRQARSDALNHRLVGKSREIYLFCRKYRSIRRIRERFSQFSEDRLLSFLRMMVDKRLMFEESDKYLSLAAAVNLKMGE